MPAEKREVSEVIADATTKVNIAFLLLDQAIESLTDEEAEKLVWDKLLDRVEDRAEKIKRPKFASKFLTFATRIFRERYDIPDND